jgi:hypothetical protein
MNWFFSLFGRSSTADDEPAFENYRKFRALGRSFNPGLIRQLPPAALPESAKKLGLYKAGTLILNQDDEIAVAYDYCLHHHRRVGKNLIDRTLENAPPPADSDEWAYLRALSEARFSVFRIEEILPRRGARLADLVTGESFAIMDLGLASTGMPGTLVAGRLLRFENFAMSAGTLIPMHEQVFETRIVPVIRKFWPDETTPPATLAPAQAAAFEAQVLRIALHAEEDLSFYTDMES